MQKIGYSLIDNNNNEIEFWGTENEPISTIPSVIFLNNGNVVHCPELDVSYNGDRIVERWLEANDNPILIKTGDTVTFSINKIIVTNVYMEKPVSLPSKDELLIYNDKKRLEVEGLGISVDDNGNLLMYGINANENTPAAQAGHIIETNRDSQNSIAAVERLVQKNPNLIINFKAFNGFFQANSVVIQNISNSVFSYVEKTFNIENKIVESIQSNTIMSYIEIDDVYKNDLK